MNSNFLRPQAEIFSQLLDMLVIEPEAFFMQNRSLVISNGMYILKDHWNCLHTEKDGKNQSNDKLDLVH